LVLDKQVNGALPALTDIWSGTTYFKNFDNIARFDVLSPALIQPQLQITGISSLPVAASPDPLTFMKFEIPIRFQSNNGDVTDLPENGLFYCFRTSGAVSIRVYYIDIY